MKKSLYIYLSSLLGILLFLVLHRILVFTYFLLAGLGYAPFIQEASSLQLLALEYFSLILALMLGSWYGIWVGMYWYEKVYEERNHPGLVGHLANKYWPKSKSYGKLADKITAARKKMETDMMQLGDLTKTIPAAVISPEPIKRKIVRKRAPKKLAN